MICRECGAKLHERDQRPDGSYRCPDCGAILHPHKRDSKGHAAAPELPTDLFEVAADGPLMTEDESADIRADGQASLTDRTPAQPESVGRNDAEPGADSVRNPAAKSHKAAHHGKKRKSHQDERNTVEAGNQAELPGLAGDALFDVESDAPAASVESGAGKRKAKRRKRGGMPVGLVITLLIFALVLLMMIYQLMQRGHGDSARTAVNAASVPDATILYEAPTPSPAPTATPSPTPTAVPTPTPSPTPTPEPTPVSVHFRAIGDIMMHEAQLEFANKGHGVYDFAPQFQFVREALSKADYTIANLEFTISTDGHYSGYPSFHAPESVLDALKDCGIDLFTTANNHILDAYFDGVVKTNDELDERGFAHLGSYRTQEEANTPLVLDIKGIKVGFLAYTEHVNGLHRYMSASKSFCVKPLMSADFKADVQALRELGAELVICLPHWGTENVRRVNDDCKRLALEMVDAGVDVILGSHPHMVQTMGMLKREVDGKQKNVLIAFSMGNFIANMQQRYRNNGIIVDFTVTREPDGTISVHDPGYVPIYVYNRGRGFTALCSLEYYDEQPKGMGHDDYIMLRQSVSDVAEVITQDGIARLVN